MKIKIRELRNLMQKVLMTGGFSDAQSMKIAEVLLYAEMAGKKTQGVIKLLGEDPIQNVVPAYDPKIIKETKIASFIDGGRNPGILVSRMATSIVIEKCLENGLAIVGTNNTYASTGAIGYYANKIAEHGLIGIVMAGSPKGVAPYGGIDAIMGTNPIAFGFPTENDPIIFDMATAASTWYGLVRAKALVQQLPEGVAMDEEGNPTRDPEAAIKGAILAFDNTYKGSGLNLVIELLTGALVGQVSSDTDGKWYCGNLFIAIDPDLFIGREQLKENSSLLLKKIKGSRASKEFKSVPIAGERSTNARKFAERKGEIDVEDKLLRNLLELAG